MFEPYLVRLCDNDKKVHAFDRIEQDKEIWRARCGHSVPDGGVLPAMQKTPSCIQCLIQFGTAEADHLGEVLGCI